MKKLLNVSDESILNFSRKVFLALGGLSSFSLVVYALSYIIRMPQVSPDSMEAIKT